MIARVLQEAVTTGTLTNLSCAACAAAVGVWHQRPAAEPINAISHVVWGDADPPRAVLSWRDTAVGLAVNEAACGFWASLHAALLASRRPPLHPSRVAVQAGAIAAVAYLVDYHLVPPRFTPGFEKVVPRRALFPIYVAIAAGLLAGTYVSRRGASTDRRRAHPSHP